MEFTREEYNKHIEQYERKAQYQASAVHFLYSLTDYDLFVASGKVGDINITKKCEPNQHQKDSFVEELWRTIFNPSNPSSINDQKRSYTLLFYYIDRFPPLDQRGNLFAKWHAAGDTFSLNANVLIACPKGSLTNKPDETGGSCNQHQIFLTKVESWRVHEAAGFVAGPIVDGHLNQSNFYGAELIGDGKTVWIDDPLTLDDIQPLSTGLVTKNGYSDLAGQH